MVLIRRPVSRAWALTAAMTILAWSGIELGQRRSSSISDDWHGWRQADTQAIARNFAFEDFDVFAPRIDWRRDGPGYVEAELQVYPALIAVAMRVAGESIWSGQLLSLASVVLAAGILFVTLAWRFGDFAAYLALVGVLSTKGVAVIATSIQPDTLAFLCFTAGFVAFRAYLDEPRTSWLVLWVVATATAGLVKPTTLELGVAQAIMCLLLRPDLLRSPRTWIGWIIVLAVVGAHLLHGHRLYLQYGNTFGVLSGGDSKLPSLTALMSPRLWLSLLRFEVVWGVGLLGALAAVYLAARGRIGVEEAALGAGALCLSIVAFRYATGSFGTHYHLPHVVLGAWFIAKAGAMLGRQFAAGTMMRRLVVSAVLIAGVLSYARAVHSMRVLPPEPETAVGRMLAAVALPGSLVAVRARAPSVEREWGTVNNFEDPRVFYVSRTKGWVLANDHPGASRLAEAASRGARYYAHVNQVDPDPELRAWLNEHADLVSVSTEGAIFRLHQSLTK